VRELERSGVIVGYRALVDPAAVGRGLEVLVDVEIRASDIGTIREFEATVASYDEVVELRRMFGKPDYRLRVAVADHGAYERFLTAKLMGLDALERVQSHLTMKRIKGSD
jgi:DNA-binding Lrp family transcriptional regulator